MKSGARIGAYHLLFVYLRDRFANRVVLTFAEIEDLVGFHLPDEARLDRLWWEPAPNRVRSSQSEAWILANRTASVNLSARRVVFDRIASRGPDELHAFHGS
jgi:hypothetical protein